MNKKIICGLILFVMFFSIFSTFSKVFAKPIKGEQLKVLKDAEGYKYNEESDKLELIDKTFFKKGEIVKYLGNVNTVVTWKGIFREDTECIEVSSLDGKKTGYIKYELVESLRTK